MILGNVTRFAALVALAGACSSSTSGPDAGGGVADLAQPGGDLASSGGDLSSSPPDLAPQSFDLIGVDVSCDPNAALAGGDPVGTWAYVAGCVSDAAFSDITTNCAGSSVSNTALAGPSGMPSPQGTLVLDPGGTFSRNVKATITANATIGGTCASLGCATLASSVATFTGNKVTATCTGAGTCSCALTANVATTETGVWTQNGANVTATASGGTAQTYAIGVAGAVLRYRGAASNSAGDHDVTYVLVK